MKPIGDYTLNELLDFCETYYCRECPMNTGGRDGCWAKTATAPCEWAMLEESAFPSVLPEQEVPRP